MTPYLAAWEKYHADGVPGVAWRVAMEYHLQHPQAGVVSNPAGFVMARLVMADDPPAVLWDLSRLESRKGLDCWHVWAAAGSLKALGLIAVMHRAPFVSFHRRADMHPRVYRLDRLFRAYEFEIATEAARHSAACDRDRAGEGGD
jgi:hypothetical protein